MSELGARLEAAVDAMLAEVAMLPDELIGWKPAADVWSVMEILCHVDEFVPYWTGQALQIVKQPDEQWGRTHAHAGRLEAVGRAESRSLADVTNTIRIGARESAAAIDQLRDSDLAAEAVSRNPRWGKKPASFVIHDLVIGHVEKHLGQIRRNVMQFHALR